MSRNEVQEVKELAKELFVTGEKEAPEIIAELGISTPTFYKWAREKDPNDPNSRSWNDMRADFREEQRHLVETYRKLEQSGDDFEELHKANLADAAKMMAIGMAKLKKLLLSDNPLPLVGEIQKVSASLEKMGNAYYKDKNKGVEKSEKTTVNVAVDTDRILAFIMKARERGVAMSWDEANQILNPEAPALPPAQEKPQIIDVEAVEPVKDGDDK